MSRMTRMRVNGIKTGYWSPETKENLVQRLAEYEDTGMDPKEICDLIGTPKWYKPKEQLPLTDEKVLLVTITKKCLKNCVIGYWDGERWVCGMNSNVIAWTYLPQMPTWNE